MFYHGPSRGPSLKSVNHAGITEPALVRTTNNFQIGHITEVKTV